MLNLLKLKISKKPTLVMLVGNIGSGKSTLTKQLAKKKFLILSRDALRYMIGGGKYKFADITEPVVHSMNLVCLKEIVKRKMNVVLDETNMSPRIRSVYIKAVKRYNYNVIAIILPKIGMKESIDRRMFNPHDQPDRKIWERVWRIFDRMYKEPIKEEGFNKIIKL